MKRLSVNFHPFGARTAASARLRAWELADELVLQGHDAAVNADAYRQVEVFQKVRPYDRLAQAHRRGVFTVYDFDDNYLLDDAGTRADILRFVNLVDLVTVGSDQIFDAVAPYHDRVHLFENPLDIHRGSGRRPPLGWRGKVGWFGNRTNLTALEALDLDYGVTTVTSGGDVEWTLETVDDVVRDFDLILLPVQLTEWTASKNANRLLKCVALGVPFLASRTPEHERVVAELGLPDRLLVDAEADWSGAIDALRDDWESVEQTIAGARNAAYERWGIRRTATSWLHAVHAALADQRHLEGPAERRPRRHIGNEAVGAAFADLDVVVLSDNEPEFAGPTLASLDRDGLELRSVALVSANHVDPEIAPAQLPVDVRDDLGDFFDVYRAVADRVSDGHGDHVLLLRGGTQLGKGFWHDLARTMSGASVHLFREQHDRSARLAGLAPATIDQAVLRPFIPSAILFSRDAVTQAGGLDGSSLIYGIWELLLRLYTTPGTTVRHHDDPLIVASERVARRHLIQSYSVWLDLNRPDLTNEMPGHDEEWRRLSYTLHAAIVDRHRDLFATRSPSLTPALLDHALKLERDLDRRSLSNDRLRAEIRKLERTVKEVRAKAAAVREQADRKPKESGNGAVSTSTEIVLASPQPVRGPLRAPARVAVRVGRAVVPSGLRDQLYRRYRRQYLSLFPERDPRLARDDRS